MIGDLAHTLQKPWRSLKDLQDLAINGKLGKQPGNHKLFHQLHVSDLKKELHARSVYDYGKDDIQSKLDEILWCSACSYNAIAKCSSVTFHTQLGQLHGSRQ